MKYLLLIICFFSLFAENRTTYLEKGYDLEGNCVQVIQEDSEGNIIHEISWEYDSTNLIISCLENKKKRTSYTYTESGLLKELIKPDGTIVTHEYDCLGREIELYSSDYTIAYAFIYDLNGQLITSTDLINNQTTTRKVDGKGRVLEEKLSNGLKVFKTYDHLGRRRRLTLPDGSSIDHVYDAFYLRGVNRYSKEKELLYTHSYTEYDLSENLIEEQYLEYICSDTNINNPIIQTHSYDEAGRKYLIRSAYLSQLVEEFDSCSQVKELITDTRLEKEQKTFEYDNLNALIAEKGFENYQYKYDEKNNRISKNDDEYIVDNFNQLSKTSYEHYEYDSNGNPVSIEKNEEKICLSYDALDRLVEVLSPGKYKITYSYDSFHRRVASTTYSIDEEEYIEKESFFYLYDDTYEIGKTTSSHRIKELRVLGITPRMELGAAIAIEIDQKLYIPFHDLFSNVLLLLDPYEDKIVETYEITAFGEIICYSETQKSINPWKYCSKRSDELTGYIFFGRRYYDPNTGRFLTTDPSGYTDSYNLYTFVFNNPLSKFDPTGLQSFDTLLSSYPNQFQSSLKNPIDLTQRAIEKGLYTYQNIKSYSENSELLRALPRDFHKPSFRTDLQRPELSSGRIGFVNGINTLHKEAKSHMSYLSDYTGGKNIHGVYNQSRGTLVDLVESAHQLAYGTPTLAVIETINMWSDFFQKNNKDPFLHICHSQGAIITRNSLEFTRPAYRNRIIVVAIAPAAYINKNLCQKVYHYASKNDIVPKIDVIGRMRCQDTTKILEPHPYAQGQDHSFQSPTYSDIIRDHIDEYLEEVKR